jgi:hypothetical protein
MPAKSTKKIKNKEKQARCPDTWHFQLSGVLVCRQAQPPPPLQVLHSKLPSDMALPIVRGASMPAQPPPTLQVLFVHSKLPSVIFGEIKPKIRCSIRQYTSAYISIRQHTSASAYVGNIRRDQTQNSLQHTSAYVSIRQHTSAYVSIRRQNSERSNPNFATQQQIESVFVTIVYLLTKYKSTNTNTSLGNITYNPRDQTQNSLLAQLMSVFVLLY